jgi:hypothetical protein
MLVFALAFLAIGCGGGAPPSGPVPDSDRAAQVTSDATRSTE